MAREREIPTSPLHSGAMAIIGLALLGWLAAPALAQGTLERIKGGDTVTVAIAGEAPYG